LNRTVGSQIEACIAKLSCEICTLCEILRSIERLVISSVSGQPISPIFKVQDIEKREQNTTEVNLSLFYCVHHQILRRRITFRKPVPFSFSGKETPNLGYPLD